MNIGEKVTLTIEDLGMNGEGISHYEGVTFFVPFALTSEKVVAKIAYFKQKMAFCTLIKVLIPSTDRVEPVCPRFYKCGGCSLQHLNYTAQLTYKKRAVANVLKKNCGFSAEIGDTVPSPNIYQYRNKIQLPFGTDADGLPVLGFFEGNSHKVVQIESCQLHGDWATKLINTVLQFARKYNLSVYNEAMSKGLLRHLVARNLDGALTVTLVINGDSLPNADALDAQLSKEFSEFSFYLNVNKKNSNVILGDQLLPVRPNRIVKNVGGIDIEVNPLSFFQINNEIRDKIYNDVVSQINPDDKTIIIDAYSGVGLLGAILAKSGAQIHNIEIIPEAITDADRLYSANNLSADNRCGDAAKLLPELLTSLKIKADQKPYIILDPPRKGCSTAVLSSIVSVSKTAPNIKIVYVSCNPATLSRDLAILSSAFVITSVTPYDMFPQTPHIETLICLSKKSF